MFLFLDKSFSLSEWNPAARRRKKTNTQLTRQDTFISTNMIYCDSIEMAIKSSHGLKRRLSLTSACLETWRSEFIPSTHVKSQGWWHRLGIPSVVGDRDNGPPGLTSNLGSSSQWAPGWWKSLWMIFLIVIQSTGCPLVSMCLCEHVYLHIQCIHTCTRAPKTRQFLLCSSFYD